MVAIHKLVALSLVCVASVSGRHHAHAEQAGELAAEAPAPADATLDADVDVERRRHRRKRWYSGYGYGQPAVYRDDAAPPPAPPFDPFTYIYRRLDELATLVRQSNAPQPLPPIFVPYPIYLPQGGCGCAGAPGPAAPAPTGANATLPTFPNRVKPDEDDYDDEPIRPISFTPIRPHRPLSRPVPGVEHGSTQAGAGAGQQQGREPGALGQAPPPPPAAAAAAPSAQPSRCDLATLTCCHQRYTTEQCFSALGCPAALRGGDPCDSRTLANIVSVFQKFYAQS